MRAVPRVGLHRLWSGSDLDYLVVLTMAGPTSEIRQILAQCGTTDIQVKMSNTLSYNNVRGVAQLGSAPALGANFWRRWASASVGNAGFLRQLRRPASVGVDAVFGTVW